MDRQEIAIMIHRQAIAWKNENIEAIVTDFAQDGLFVAGNQKLKGKEAIKKAAENYFKQFTNTQIKIKRLLIEDNAGAVEWDWSDRDRQTGIVSHAEDAIIFELENNKIAYWREYIEKIK
jgi:uncharacterized protein (TIGR02246 family)